MLRIIIFAVLYGLNHPINNARQRNSWRSQFMQFMQFIKKAMHCPWAVRGFFLWFTSAAGRIAISDQAFSAAKVILPVLRADLLCRPTGGVMEL